MKVVIQRVSEASVTIDEVISGKIDQGLLILVGIEDADDFSDIEWLCRKIVNLRIFSDAEGLMNLAAKDVNAGYLVISQFTLHASTKKGNRPSYIKAAKPPVAIPLYEQFVVQLGKASGQVIETGKFGADMKVRLLNDGPVTLIIDSQNKN